MWRKCKNVSLLLNGVNLTKFLVGKVGNTGESHYVIFV